MPYAGTVGSERLGLSPNAALTRSSEDEERLLAALVDSPSPSVYPFFILSLDAGLRPSETRRLHRHDLKLKWEKGIIIGGEIIVPESKTVAGNRIVPLTSRAAGALSPWLSRFGHSGQSEKPLRTEMTKAGLI